MTMDHMSIYRQLRADGVSEADATKAMMRDHGMSFEAAVDLSWLSAKGKVAPKQGSLAAIKHNSDADDHFFNGE